MLRQVTKYYVVLRRCWIRISDPLCIVDDHEIVAIGLSNMISKISGCEILGTFDSAASFIDFIENKNDLNLVFVDISMPNMSGLELLRFLTRWSA